MFAFMEFQVNFPGKDAEIRQKLPLEVIVSKRTK